jgi:hypothetical protein
MSMTGLIVLIATPEPEINYSPHKPVTMEPILDTIEILGGFIQSSHIIGISSLYWASDNRNGIPSHKYIFQLYTKTGEIEFQSPVLSQLSSSETRKQVGHFREDYFILRNKVAELLGYEEPKKLEATDTQK